MSNKGIMMILWLNENKDWVFSGVGVAFVTLISSYFFRYSKKKRLTSPVIKGQNINSAGRDIIINTSHTTDPSPRSKTNTIRKQSVAFVYKKTPELKVLLVKTSGRLWTFPKGTNIEGQANYETARINALEEAGAIGRIEKKSFSFYKHYKQELKNSGEECLNEVFLLKIDKEIDSTEKHRHPTWFTFDEALEKLSEGRDLFYAGEFSRVLNEAKILLTR